MDKKLILNDRMNINDNLGIKGTRVIARVPGTDKVLWELENKVLAAGSAFVAANHFDFGSNEVPYPVTPSYNVALNLENSEPKGTAPMNSRKIYLFCMGTDGCGETSAQQYEVDYSKWLKPEDMIPFRYTNADLTLDERKKYYGKALEVDESGKGTNYYSYYFKAFETDPLWIQEYIDGSRLSPDMYNDTVTSVPIQSFVQLKLMISPSDAREWFKAKDIRNGYINTISLLQGWYTEIGGHRYYQDIHPVTKLNFPTEYLIDPTKGLDITYDLFY